MQHYAVEANNVNEIRRYFVVQPAKETSTFAVEAAALYCRSETS